MLFYSIVTRDMPSGIECQKRKLPVNCPRLKLGILIGTKKHTV